MPNPRAISPELKLAILADPCRICARADDKELDHIVPVSAGGGRHRSNLQPLCRVCNVLKVRLGTNVAVRAWIDANPAEFARRQQRRTDRLRAIRQGEHI